MKHLLLLGLLALSNVAFATNNNESGPGPNQDHTCQGGHNCNTTSQGGHNEQGQDQDQSQGQVQGQEQGQLQGQSQSSENNNTNLNLNSNSNENNSTSVSRSESNSTSYSEGGDAYAEGGSANQGQTQSSDNSNSSNNSSSQNVTFEGTGKADHYNKYGNNVSAYAPAIYSSSACTAGGLSAGVAGMGFGASIGGAKQDPQCQIRENARILAGLDTSLAIEYLCKNPGIDVGAVLGAACKPTVIVAPPIVIPEPEQPEQPIEVVTGEVKG